MTNEGGLMDYRDVGELASYVAEKDRRDSYSGVSECPECGTGERLPHAEGTEDANQ